MHDEKNTILFTLVYNGEAYQVQTNGRQYHTLMILVADHIAIPGFGLCSGMGSCGTCMVEIKNKHCNTTTNTLSCDIYINDELANTIINIPLQRY